MFSKFQCMFFKSHDISIVACGSIMMLFVFLVVFDIPSIETPPLFNHGKQISYECIKYSNEEI